MSVESTSVEAGRKRDIHWPGRLWLIAQFTLVAVACNALALQLPGSAPFLVGNIAAVAITLRFGAAWSWPAALLATVVTGNAYWVALALLECLLVARYARASRPLHRVFLRVWLPLLPLVLWATLPEDASDLWLWALGASTVLVNGAVALVGGRQLAQFSRSPRHAAKQPMAALLATQLSTLMAVPFTVAAMLLLQIAHQQDLQRTALVVEGAAQALGAQVLAHLKRHRDAVAQAVAFLPTAGVEATLEQTARTYPDFLTLLATDRHGQIVAAFRDGGPVDAGQRNVADREYFRRAMSRRQAVVAPVIRGRGLGIDIIVAVAAPIITADDRRAGVVQGALGLDRLAAKARLGLRAAKLDYAVLDDAGQVVFSSLPDYPPLTSGDAGTLRDGGLAQPWWARRLFNAPSMSVGEGGTHLLMRHRDAAMDWQAVVLQPVPPLERVQSLRSLLAAIGVLLVIVGFQRISQRFAQRHARGLSAIVDRRRGFDPVDGSLPPLGPMLGSSAELTELIDDFNHAGQRLRELHDALRRSVEAQARLNRELEARVDKRTAELRAALASAKPPAPDREPGSSSD